MTDVRSKPPSTELVEPSEDVLRRIPQHFYPDPNAPRQPQWVAFKPSKRDVDGLSVGRLKLVRSLADYARTTRGERSLAQVAVADLRSIELSVTTDPLPNDPAHALIPELNAQNYATSKRRIKELAMQIAREFTKMVFLVDGSTDR